MAKSGGGAGRRGSGFSGSGGLPKGRGEWSRVTPSQAASILNNSRGMTRANYMRLSSIAGSRFTGR
jgi:hypothetical protein